MNVHYAEPPGERAEVIRAGQRPGLPLPDAGPDRTARELVPPTLLFVHLPRTGGTTLKGILEREYGESAYLRLRNGIVMEDGVVSAGDDPFFHLPSARRGRLLALSGHMSVGLHAWIPGPARYVTLFRDPVERVVSLYRYIASRPEHPLHPAIVREGLTLRDCLTHSRNSLLQFHNGQVRMLTGAVTGARLPLGARDSQRVRLAKRLLDEHFELVGVTERFEDLVVLAWRRFRWRVPLYRPVNASRGQRTVAVDPKTRALIEERNSMDREIYEYARERLADVVASAGPEFVRDRALFRMLNHAGGRE
ncbi:MAG: sulfotransferase family 2 domain-containing protein [Chloroflexi bacterium]|nr:sulfotransferase family 2 domain-containing protein [Chloroflexota bacterium]